jgi:membrane associated rhomboid family serine protease
VSAYRRSNDRLPFATSPYPWTLRLVLINVIVFVLMLMVIRTPWGIQLFNELILVPSQVLHGHLWQLITYMFMHSPSLERFLFIPLPTHIVFNMLILWMFGREVEMTLGSGTFLRLYFLAGLVAALCSMFTGSPVLGASGAVLGILAVYGSLFPDRIILAFFFIPMRMKVFMWVIAGIDLMGAIQGGGNIAHLAHIGGFFTGILMMRTGWYRKRWFDLGELRRQRELDRQRKRHHRVDEILDKVSREGIQSLSREEREFLERMRRER